ncbi:SAM-dependent methyltransferase [Streptomyces virginiae]|uniref:SAM-dependent methyltransferase n=1 Tax=Streptomyces TaxID=1883 RepID=UPI002E2CFD8F|nr:SAM-dependent methyltransferase [Streptomyces sp. NBC_00239]WSX96978.1 SAM-dependent methyltransferase [Streptomyces goshikiensis]
MTAPDYGVIPLGEDALRRPSASRIAHLLIGGHRDAYEADTALTDQLRAIFSHLDSAARIGRAYRTLTAQHLAHLGFRQYLDLGCGYPAPDTGHPDIHHLIHPHHPAATVVYIDGDRIALAHAQAAACGAAGVHHLLADLRHLPDVLHDLTVSGILDRDVPTAVLAHDVLPYLPDHTAGEVLAALRGWLAPGSVLSISHATTDYGLAEVMSKLTSAYEVAGITYQPRPHAVVSAMFGGWGQLGSGLVPVAGWHANHPDRAAPEQVSAAYAGIAIKPARRLP